MTVRVESGGDALVAHVVMAVLVREREALAADVLEAVDEQAGAAVARPEAEARDLVVHARDHDGHARVALDRGEQAGERLSRGEPERGPRLAGALGADVGVVAGHGRER